MKVLNQTTVIPTINKFRDFFYKPQFFHFSRYMTGLTAAEKGEKNIETMNSMFIDNKHQSSMNRFITKSNWDPKQFND